MDFKSSIQTCFKKYAEFDGCASRSEFWWWVLFIVVTSIVLSAVIRSLAALFTLATMIPYFAVTARRLHDTNRSGWLQLIGLIPVLGWILLIIWCAQPTSAISQYGRVSTIS